MALFVPLPVSPNDSTQSLVFEPINVDHKLVPSSVTLAMKPS